MNESSITRVLLEKLRKNRDWVVIKHADRFTVGVPDTSVTNEHATWWLEKKFLKNTAKTPTPVFQPSKYLTIDPQLMTMVKLEKHGVAYYVIFFNYRYGVIYQMIWKPRVLLDAIRAEAQVSVYQEKNVLDTGGYYCSANHLDFTTLFKLIGGADVT